MKEHKIAMFASSDHTKFARDVQTQLNFIEKNEGTELVSTGYSHTFQPGIGFNHSCLIHYTKTIKS